ncbi:serine hydrolase domain-containing protein [Acinetobacter calcoaceticus]|uniref:serine hydrolase domain-containing protein n=1 Tax=Acinetobacter calcoaceticus TaxID=471 RepID=UPI002234FD35|nr:serine hydrolase domain-containing protein [Acinetobacter calcoaceticus]
MINVIDGLDTQALEQIKKTVEADIDSGLYDGASIIVARHGKIGLNASLGWSNREEKRKTQSNDIYTIFSMTKAFTNFLVLQAIDKGYLSLMTKVVEIIPEFYGRDRFRTSRKDKITVGHLLTHRAGLVSTPTPIDYSELGDFKKVIDAICQLDVTGEPGVTQNYSPTLNHSLLAEMVRRVYKADSIAQLMQEKLFEPLGMESSSLGLPNKFKNRHVPVKVKFPDGQWLKVSDIEIMNEIINEKAEMPWVGAVSSINDIFKFTEMLRQGGTYEGSRLLSPAIIDFATQNHTGSKPHDLYITLAESRGWEVPPANMGLGFALGGSGFAPSYFGPLVSERTYGNYGAGSTLFWVDPKRDLTFICLTSGVLEESENILRFQKLSTLAVASAN